jgi:four helix bundle protein
MLNFQVSSCETLVVVLNRNIILKKILCVMAAKIYDLEDRLVDFTCRMIDVVEALPNNRAGNYIAGQLIRSCHSPTFNYGEAQAAESTNDFIHKMGVVLKELKESRTALKVIIKKEFIKPIKKLEGIYNETEELIAIIAKSIVTAKKNRENKK